MGYPTKIQLIKRKASEQWYVNFPAQVAHAMEFEKGETFEWIVEDIGLLALKREKVPPSLLKKKHKKDCSQNSSCFPKKGGAPSGRSGFSTGPKVSR